MALLEGLAKPNHNSAIFFTIFLTIFTMLFKNIKNLFDTFKILTRNITVYLAEQSS